MPISPAAPRFVAPLRSSHARIDSSSSETSEMNSMPPNRPSLEIPSSTDTVLPPPLHPARLSPTGTYRPPSPSNSKDDAGSSMLRLSPSSPAVGRPPSPRLPRRSPSPAAATITPFQLPQISINNSIPGSVSTNEQERQDEQEYTEDELRTMYDDEEVQRFLSVFHAQVNEVTLLDPHVPGTPKPEVPQRAIVTSQSDENPESSTKVIAGLAPPEGQSAGVDIRITAPSTTSLGESESDDDDSDSGSDVEDDQCWTAVSTDEVPPQELPRPGAPEIQQGASCKEENRPRGVRKERAPSVWLSEKVAWYVVQNLPDSRAIDARTRRSGGRPAKFTISRMRATAQRTYLAMYPVYVPLFLQLWDIARWVDWWKSARLCLVYWMLWFFNLLLPALLCYFTLRLIRHRLMPYPTLEQLQRRRQTAYEAEQFGDALAESEASPNGVKRGWKAAEGFGMGLTNSLAAARSSDNELGLWTMWKIATGNVSRLHHRRGREKERDKERVAGTGTGIASLDLGMKKEDDEDEVLTRREARDAADWRRIPLIFGDELADVHERVKNIVLWRRPEASKKYATFLIATTLAAAFLPAQVLAKAVYGIIGILYWFVIPVLCAMTRKQRQRIPPPFYDVPTDAEYAMEIIGMRLAQGKSVVPAKQRGPTPFSRSKSRSKASLSTLASKLRGGASTTSLSSPGGLSPQTADSPSTSASKLSPVTYTDSPADIRRPSSYDEDDEVSEVETVPRAGKADLVSAEGKKSRLHRLVDGVHEMTQRADQRIRDLPSQNQVFTAQHKHLTGLITLHANNIQFTPFLSSRERIKIDLASIRGVKKVGRFKGLMIRYMAVVPARRNAKGELEVVIGAPPVDGDAKDDGQERLVASMETEIKFNWVGGRDELFARIVGSRGTQWVSV